MESPQRPTPPADDDAGDTASRTDPPAGEPPAARPDSQPDTPPDTRPAAPPPRSGITVEETPDGTRITLPRLYTRADLVLTAVAGAVAIWMAVWLDGLMADPTASTFGMGVMAAVGLAFGAIAVSQGFTIAAPRVIEDGGDRLVLSRRIGVRRVQPRPLPKAAIRSVEWVWQEGETSAGEPGEVVIRTEADVHRIGRYLDVAALEWLEGAVRQLADRGRPPGPAAPSASGR